jgi:leucyl aminopeptidase
MDFSLSYTDTARLETECLVIVVVDNGEKDKNAPALSPADAAVQAAAGELLASGEFTGKIFETALLYRPQGLKAKRLLLLGGGKGKSFTSNELRKLAGAAARFLKPKNIRSFTFLLPQGTPEAARAAVEGALVGNFDPDVYKSDRKDQKIEAVTLAAPASAKSAGLERAVEVGRILGESQNFTRDLVNEPGNRMTPTVLAERARKMAVLVGGPGVRRTPGADRAAP